MWKPTIRSECCAKGAHEPLPCNLKCFAKDICNEINDLQCKHKSAFTSRKRLHFLAQPKHRIARFIPKCPCKFEKLGDIVNLEQPTYTRTEQLAYPQVRKLLLFKDAYKRMLPERVEIMNRLIKKSLFSVYSRLENVQPPEKRIPIHKWDKAEWKKHTKYLKKLAKHKEAKKVKGPHNPQMPFKKMKRYKKLARPKNREELEKLDWVLTPEMKSFTPTKRLLTLAAPKSYNDEALYNPLPNLISPLALKYKASPRILELAQAAEKRLGESELKENPFAISPNALKAKASARIEELAEPKEYENVHLRENPEAISPAALKAVPTPRIIELAKPRGT